MTHVVALPVLAPLALAAVALAVRRWRRVQEAICVLASAGSAAISIALLVRVRAEGLLVTQLGGWPAPFGIAFVADLLSTTLLVAISVVAFLVVVYATCAVDRERRSAGLLPLMLVLLAGASGALLTGDVFNLFVWFEVMLFASFVLVALGGTRAQLEGALKYVALNMLASMLLLSATGLLYGMTGSLSFADIALRLEAGPPAGATRATALLFFSAFAIKAAVFPFFSWLPASYHTPPAAVTALFSGSLTKVGVYAILRTGTLLFPPDDGDRSLLLVAAGATMLTGVLGAAAQSELRRILSFHIVSQIGYAIMGFAIGGVLGIAGALFFVLHNIAAKTALLLAAGVVRHERGTEHLDELGGIARQQPFLAALFLVPALSLAGIPPLSGFAGKLLLVRAGVEAEAWSVTAVALLVSLLTLYSMMKIWMRAFWAPAPSGASAPTRRIPHRAIGSLAAVALATVLLGVLAEPVVDLCLDAAASVLDREAYAREVLARGGAR
ncbi:MAG: proton-conducting transporter membrane subunit [Sandaracinaceae bacterium]|nr:proton-conducting transporter membrane subunit [Sandaracinaceae bacterium]